MIERHLFIDEQAAVDLTMGAVSQMSDPADLASLHATLVRWLLRLGGEAP